MRIQLGVVALIALSIACGSGSEEIPPSPDAGVVPSPDAGETCATVADAQCDEGWCIVPAGCLRMGSPPSELCRDDSETQHEVHLTRDVLLSRGEITRAEFERLTGYNPYGALSDWPAVHVTWNEAAVYANARSDEDA